MADQSPDPPMRPYPGSSMWFESGPESIRQVPDEAALMVRVGMAANAITGQLEFGVAALQSPGAVRRRDLILGLVNCAALIHESIKLVKHNRTALMSLANEMELDPEAADTVQRLCAGTHPANDFVERARNKVGFHWDPAVIGPSVKDFGSNEMIVWLELSGGQMVHRLASDVLAHVLIGTATLEPDPIAAEVAVTERLTPIWQALNMINAFFVACAYGYVWRHGVDRRDREA